MPTGEQILLPAVVVLAQGLGQLGVNVDLPGGQLTLGGLGRKPEDIQGDVLRSQVKIRWITDFDKCLLYSRPAPSSG